MLIYSWSDFPDFTEAEFTCKCGCGLAKVHRSLVGKLQNIRDALRKPLVITSGYRCPTHNANVSTTGATGPHTTGYAADIKCSGDFAHSVVEQGILYGMTGIGVQQKGPHASRFIHLDCIVGAGRPTIWSY